ncbi:MAG: DUF362 domain-containing protein [Bryobacterales bacterium]|nr:DUF362 domain-containing protein [Bryobacteraceae bacterium]MDW8131115.1 DUF362 domain-containing protein [Bryobacterales bacterium]
MAERISRRGFLGWTAAAPLAGPVAFAQQAPARYEPQLVYPCERLAVVSLVRGQERRKLIHDALEAIDDQIRPLLKRKKYVVIKPNNVSTVNQLASTHADTLRGILDYLARRTKGPVVIAESSAGETMEGYHNFKYPEVAREFRSLKVSLVDLNEEAKYEVIPLLSPDLHVQPVRLAARLLDPDAFIISAGILKTHNTVIATLSVKNMTLGAPLRNRPKETPRWNDKRKYHGGVRQTHYNMMLTAQKMAPYWGLAVLDGFEGMEGNGPSSGTPVPHRIAIASTDFIAADRVGVEVMGIDANWMGYLLYCWQVGLGQYDLAKIAIRGEAIASVRRNYRLHRDIERELQWMGPLTEVPPRLG